MPGKLCVLACVVVFSSIAAAQPARPAALRGVGIDQKLDQQVPLDLPFVDESGRAVELQQYFGKRPVVLALVYYQCPMLCNLVLNGLVYSLDKISLAPGKDYELVTVSFDPRETHELAAAKKQNYVEKFDRPGVAAGWHFLTGQDGPIRSLADSVGFQYSYNPVTNQFAHAAGIIVLTPQGRVARYFFGINYQPQDVRLGLVEASANKIGSPVDQFLLYCFHYDPAQGKYGLVIMNVLRALGSATVLAMGALILVLLRRDSRHKPHRMEGV